MTMRDLTKLVFLFCFLTVTCVPVYMWVFADRSLAEVAGFVGASAGPMGVLTGAMAYRRVQGERSHQQGGGA